MCRPRCCSRSIGLNFEPEHYNSLFFTFLLSLPPVLVATWTQFCVFFAQGETGRTRLCHGFRPQVSEVSFPCFPKDSCDPLGSRFSILLCVWFSRCARAPFALTSFFGRSWVTMDFSDTSSGGWRNTTLGIQCWSCSFVRISVVYIELWSMKKELVRIALSCHFALDILCDKSETRRAQ